jgi:hypothetical protein
MATRKQRERERKVGDKIYPSNCALVLNFLQSDLTILSFYYFAILHPIINISMD